MTAGRNPAFAGDRRPLRLEYVHAFGETSAQQLEDRFLKTIDLRSDTVTRPTAAMRKAMAAAAVGDDFYREDPTVRALEEKAAALLGKPSAVLVLSGTMGNLVSLLAWAQRGDAALLAANSHIYLNEAGNLATIAGLLPSLVADPRGICRAEHVETALRPASLLQAPLSLVCLENTHNAAGGVCLSTLETEAICAAAHTSGLKVHLDGARIFNAAVALGVPAAALSRNVDSVTFCLTKGLGCPVGSLIAGPADFVARARRWRQVLGGGMRQAGVFAAAGLVALDNMIDRLAEDHANARRLAQILRGLGLTLTHDTVATNMVFVEAPRASADGDAFVSALRKAGVIVNPVKAGRIRFVTHADISTADVEEAGRRVAAVLQTRTQGRLRA
jgi:threonine aldolase